MNHSNIVTELLHKLSKNELLLQDGGSHTIYNNVNQYRNQLNSLYGSGAEEDRMAQEIMKNIDTLIPFSVLREFVEKAELQMNTLRQNELGLRNQIAGLEKNASQSGDVQRQELVSLQSKLAVVEQEITKLNAELERKEKQLEEQGKKIQEKEEELKNNINEISSLKKHITDIKAKVTDVERRTIENDPLKALLARLNSGVPSSVATTYTTAPSAPSTARS